MTQMNLSMKQTHRKRPDLWLPREGRWGRDRVGVWDKQIQATTHRMDKQQGPTVQHRELLIYSILWDKT